jgi:hemerythrin-like domain-containing protein
MMEALEILVKEHVLIHQFLESLQRAVGKLEEEEHPPKEFFEKAVEFARNFADKYHHFKEEYLLFGLLAMKKAGEMDAQIDFLKYSHDRGRSLINEIVRSLDGYSRGQEAQTLTILESLAAYISLLRQHIRREDRVFFPMAEKEISEKEHSELLKEFGKEDEKSGGKALEKNRTLLLEMGRLLVKG